MNDTIEYKGFCIEIFQDKDADSPRNWDNLGTMTCFHRKYELGDKSGSKDYSRWDVAGFQEEILPTALIALPLYLYDHGGITMSTGPFSCQWDSGQVGWIWVTREQVLKEYGCKYITKNILDKVTEVLKQEVKTYDQYLTGDVYGYIIERESEDDDTEITEEFDSCWGFYGYDYCVDEAKRQVDYYVENNIHPSKITTVKEFV